MELLTQQAYGIPAVIWWNNLERIMMAIDDLDCKELLTSRRAVSWQDDDAFCRALPNRISIG